MSDYSVAHRRNDRTDKIVCKIDILHAESIFYIVYSFDSAQSHWATKQSDGSIQVGPFRLLAKVKCDALLSTAFGLVLKLSIWVSSREFLGPSIFRTIL